jgi:ankyrin repeat protein
VLEAGADIDAADKDGWNALMTAAYYGHTDIVRLLIQSGARLDSKCNRKGGVEGGKSALALARERGHTDAVLVLREAGAAEE